MFLTLNTLNCIVISVDDLKSKLSRAQFVLYLKEKLLVMVLRQHQDGSNI